MAARTDPAKLIKTYEDLNVKIREELNLRKGLMTEQERSRLVSQEISNNQTVINELVKIQAQGQVDVTDELKKHQDAQKILVDGERKHNELLEKGVKSRQKHVDLIKSMNNQLKIGWQYLQDSDKIIRSTVLNLGLSGTKAMAMRTAFEQSAGFVTRLGGSLADIQTIQQGYAEETGRARVMTSEMVKDITAIGKGTGLGIEQATRLGAQFELMGFDAKTTMEYVQGVVDTSERMGVNTTKVMKNITDNFKKLNTYTFQQGVKGFAQMATYAEKFKIDISQALNAADISRTLEGAIDLAANLQVMGGEFAKTDPFEMLFLSRNDPAKFTEKIADMTKGVVSFRKMSDGTFEKFISPADRDRLAAVAKSMGMEASELTQIAERQAEIQKMRQQMGGMGLSDQQKELIEGAAIFDKKSGKFQVELAGTMKDISTLTKDQADSFIKEKVSLEERAKQAMTFDETFKATIETLKAALLPILKGINVILKPLSKVADMFSTLAGKGFWGIAGAAGILLAGGLAWKAASIRFEKGLENYAKGGLKNIFSGKATGTPTGGGGGGFGGGGGAGGAGSKWFTKAGNVKKGAGGLAAGQGAKALGTGAGVGAAALGIGAGIGLAAEGISKLADSMSKLKPEQAKTLQNIVLTLGGAIAVVPLLVAALFALAPAAGAAALPLLAFGGAVALVGAGIGIAAAGIGYMGKGLGEMFTAIKGSGDDFIKVAQGIGMMGLSFASIGVTLPAAIGLAFAVGRIAKHSDNLIKVGQAFENIKAVMSGSKEDFVAVENAVRAISNMNTKGGGMLADLTKLLKEPLKVEFSNGGKVNLTNDITLNLDGQKFMQKAYNVNLAIQKHESLKHGKGN